MVADYSFKGTSSDSNSCAVCADFRTSVCFIGDGRDIGRYTCWIFFAEWFDWQPSDNTIFWRASFYGWCRRLNFGYVWVSTIDTGKYRKLKSVIAFLREPIIREDRYVLASEIKCPVNFFVGIYHLYKLSTMPAISCGHEFSSRSLMIASICSRSSCSRATMPAMRRLSSWMSIFSRVSRFSTQVPTERL